MSADDEKLADQRWMSAIADEVYMHYWSFVRDEKDQPFLRVEFWREGGATATDAERKTPPWIVYIGDKSVVKVTTRGDVRRLLAALKVPFTEPAGTRTPAPGPRGPK